MPGGQPRKNRGGTPPPAVPRADRNAEEQKTMNRNDITARADAPTPASASAPNPSPTPASRPAGTPLGTTHFLTRAPAKKPADTAMSSALPTGYPASVTVVDRDGLGIARQP